MKIVLLYRSTHKLKAQQKCKRCYKSIDESFLQKLKLFEGIDSFYCKKCLCANCEKPLGEQVNYIFLLIMINTDSHLELVMFRDHIIKAA